MKKRMRGSTLDSMRARRGMRWGRTYAAVILPILSAGAIALLARGIMQGQLEVPFRHVDTVATWEKEPTAFVFIGLLYALFSALFSVLGILCWRHRRDHV